MQINYMIDVDFVMNMIPEEIRDGLKTVVYHGLRLTPNQLLVTCILQDQTNTKEWSKIFIHYHTVYFVFARVCSRAWRQMCE